MTKEIAALNAQKRDDTGGRKPKHLRNDGWLPCSLSKRSGGAESLKVKCREFENLLKRHAEHMIVDLVIGDDKPQKVLLKEVQHHPVSGNLLHADFAEISMTRRLRTSVPIALVGEPAGIVEGGVLEHVLREIEVECLPADLPESVTVDVSALKIGDTVLVKGIDLGSKVVILTGKDLAVAAVNAPKMEEEAPPEEAAAEAAAAPTEPELIAKKEKEEEGAEETPEGGKAEEEGKGKESKRRPQPARGEQ